jgi:hypothetical protein
VLKIPRLSEKEMEIFLKTNEHMNKSNG